MKTTLSALALAATAAWLSMTHGIMGAGYDSPLTLRLKAQAEKGDAKAQFALGRIYDVGQGVSADKSEAARWYMRSAKKQYAPAQASLALLHFLGEGVGKSPRRASELIDLASKAEHNYNDKEKRHIASMRQKIKEAEPTYVRFHTNYDGVGRYGGSFQEGDIAKVTKKIDDNYFEASTNFDSENGRLARWDKVDVVTSEQANRRREEQNKERRAQTLAAERQDMTVAILESGLIKDEQSLEHLSTLQIEDHYKTAQRILQKRTRSAAARTSQPQPAAQYIYHRNRSGDVELVPVGAVWNGQVLKADRFGRITPEPIDAVPPPRRMSAITEVTPDAYGIGRNADDFGRPHTYRTRDGRSIGVYQDDVERDAYGPGVHADMFGRRVYDSEP